MGMYKRYAYVEHLLYRKAYSQLLHTMALAKSAV